MWNRINTDKCSGFQDDTFYMKVEGGRIYRTMTIIKRFYFFEKVIIGMVFVPSK